MAESNETDKGWLSREGGQISLEEARDQWNPELVASRIQLSEEQRAEVLRRFPLSDWPDMPLDRYALGTPVSSESFCRWMEFNTQQIASIRGGNAMKLLIYKRLNDPGWYYDPRFANEREAWQAVRAGFVKAFDLAAEGRFAEIGSIDAISSAFSLLTKSVYTYFPDGVIPICSHAHQQHYWEYLGAQGELEGGVPGASKLLQLARERLGWPDRSPAEIARFLYWWADPRTAPEIVKIAPGPNASLWDDCRERGYIRVGWGLVGDLLAYGTKDEFRARFNELFRDTYGNQAKTTEKANEVWMLRELQPGDRVIANRGIGEVVGIGTVVEPGYEWREELGEFSETVRVSWDDTTVRHIDPIARWALKTVAPVSQADYQRILEGRHEGSGRTASPKPPVIQAPAAPAIYRELDSALKRKGQVILYGPPGTGKTYTARRFAVWWLAGRRGDARPESLLVDSAAFGRAENSLSTTRAQRRVWWVVANAKEWHWDQLFADGTVDYRYSRLKVNYSQLQEGDLVIGYQANPTKAVHALARIKQGLHQTAKGQEITLEPVAKVTNGPTYEELLKHPTLAVSEPMRFRNQGTLFALTSTEADELIAWLIERDPSLAQHLSETDSDDTIGPLTRITFHPSYGYEDFIEGYKPVSTGTGQLDLRLADGVFKRVCRAAQTKRDQPFLILIDEINRGNIAKIFGELITLLEQDKRDLAVVLPQSGQTFSVPPNVYLIGTMNTADRSIKLLDAALRRRFAFIELMPDAGLLQSANVGGLDLGAFLLELNRRVARREGREKQIGHSFFLDERGQPLTDIERFADQFRHEIVPLLQEYAYEDYRELAEYLGTGLVNAEEQRLATEKIEDPAALVAALLEAYPQEMTTAGDEAG